MNTMQDSKRPIPRIRKAEENTYQLSMKTIFFVNIKTTLHLNRSEPTEAFSDLLFDLVQGMEHHFWSDQPNNTP